MSEFLGGKISSFGFSTEASGVMAILDEKSELFNFSESSLIAIFVSPL